MKITLKQLKQLIKEEVKESASKALSPEENKPPLTADSVLSLIDDLLYEAYQQGNRDGQAQSVDPYFDSMGMNLGADLKRLEKIIKGLFAK